MSNALDYLLAARPEAMQPYFEFLKQAGSRLDPKTRALISVITKVTSRTETGFRQYLVRALRTGATAEEILDALLMAFPAIGLSGLVWAVDIISAMDIPEFRADALGRPVAWRRVAALSELDDGEAVSVSAEDGRLVYVVRRPGSEPVLYDGRCPHQMSALPSRLQQGMTLTCPAHGWKFDLAAGGACISGGKRGLRELPGKTEDGVLYGYW
ncbi:MAG: Rieske 2Fe-2S domain-containing protein [Gammaproteobacteria bacterium]|nr:Rieske 2Fe-2S domain-containing protein [Gammaproteobacteria bacterium]